MYKFLLCWRYLKTRYLAMACIISVTLGVATLIVVNSVMSGFSTKLRDRLHGLLSDVVVESDGMEGFGDPKGKMEMIRKDPFLGPRVAAMTPTLETFAMLQFGLGDVYTRPVKVIGVDPVGRSNIGGFKEFLVNQKDNAVPSLDVPAPVREAYAKQMLAARHRQWQETMRDFEEMRKFDPDLLPPPMPAGGEISVPRGAIIGNLIACRRVKNPGENEEREKYFVHPGDAVILTTVSGQKMAPVFDRFIVVDYFKSEMSEYDQNIIFVPLDYLQHLRATPDQVTSIQIKVKDYRELREVKSALVALFERIPHVRVATWEDKQGPLLAAISIEKGILNVLLFLIVAVAGFGILAIFSMIVAEKTRDIGILKALGASNIGVMKIFLSYGMLLGLVGAGLGTVIGLAITININEVEQFIARLTGQQIFDRSVYYFSEIPTDIQSSMIFYVNLGAVGIAVLFSVLPALRAAWLHPVRALRYEG